MSTSVSTENASGGAPSPDPQFAEGLTDTVREQAQSVGEQARARAREQVDRRSSELGTRVSSVAEDLRSVAEHLRSQGKTGPAGLVEHAAQRVAGAGDYLQGTTATGSCTTWNRSAVGVPGRPSRAGLQPALPPHAC